MIRSRVKRPPSFVRARDCDIMQNDANDFIIPAIPRESLSRRQKCVAQTAAGFIAARCRARSRSLAPRVSREEDFGDDCRCRHSEDTRSKFKNFIVPTDKERISYKTAVLSP